MSWYRSGSSLAQVMVCFQMASSNYLNQCWLNIESLLCHSPEGGGQDINLQNEFEIYTSKITSTSPRGQWVNQPKHKPTMCLLYMLCCPPWWFPHPAGEANLALSSWCTVTWEAGLCMLITREASSAACCAVNSGLITLYISVSTKAAALWQLWLMRQRSWFTGPKQASLPTPNHLLTL